METHANTCESVVVRTTNIPRDSAPRSVNVLCASAKRHIKTLTNTWRGRNCMTAPASLWWTFLEHRMHVPNKNSLKSICRRVAECSASTCDKSARGYFPRGTFCGAQAEIRGILLRRR
eukprot:gene12868-biopygen23005